MEHQEDATSIGRTCSKLFSSPDMVVMNTPGQNSNAVAELAFGMMITNARNHYDGTSGYELRVQSFRGFVLLGGFAVSAHFFTLSTVATRDSDTPNSCWRIKRTTQQ